MQDEIVSWLANTLDVQPIDAEARRTQGSTHPDAMDLYFEGRALLAREMFIVGCAKLWQEAAAEAVVWLRRSVETNPKYSLTRFQLAAALAYAGELDDARAAVQAGLALQPGFTIRGYRANPLSSHPTYLAGRSWD